MNLGFLGDAFDHWKGSLFELLQASGAIRDLAADPMASDLVAWEEADLALFARLLRIERGQLVGHRYTIGERQQYFAEISHPGDVFLDPDTGVATGRILHPRQYVQPSEVVGLLQRPQRTVIVYQHVRAQRVRDRVDVVVSAVQHTASGKLARFEWSSYESGTVAMLFLSQEAERTESIAGCFRRVLGRHSTGRIRSSTDRI